MSNLTIFQPTSLAEAKELSLLLSNTSMIPDVLRNKPGDILATIIRGQELGLTALNALTSIYIIKGKTVMSADLQIALSKRHPDCEYFNLLESTDLIASYEVKRKGEKPTKLSFTIEQARQAGLNGDNWKKYPAAMLRARCGSAISRAVFPDLMMGTYNTDEASEFEKDVTPKNLVANHHSEEETQRLPRPSSSPVVISPPVVQSATAALRERLAAKATPETGELIIFGPFKNQLISSLADNEVADLIAFGTEKLQGSPKAAWAKPLGAQIKTLSEELERRRAISESIETQATLEV